VRKLSVEFSAGQFVVILGRNGSGKTLTLHTLAGLRAAHNGEVRLNGVPLPQLRRRAIAQRIGLLAQDPEDTFTATVLEAVLTGRHPHLALWQWESAEDEAVAACALASVGMESFAQRHMETLSGGEQRRVAVAALLAQEPAIFLIDEPENHLDPHHQLQVLNLFRGLANRGGTVIAILHDLTLAARYADHALLLFGDGRWRAGPAREMLTGEILSELYSTSIVEVAADGRRVFVTA